MSFSFLLLALSLVAPVATALADCCNRAEAQKRVRELDAKLDLPFELAPIAGTMRNCP
jgi:hypothetical protein